MAFNPSAFDYRPDTIKRSLDQYIYGQEEAKQILSVAFWQHYSRLKRQQEQPLDPLVSSNKPNVLLIGKSGTAKTSLPEKLCGLLGVPYARINSTSLSEAGYVGDNTYEIVPDSIWRAANHKSAQVPFTVVHIDEIDKKAISLADDHDVSRGAVQNDFLSIIDGNKMATKSGVVIDTAPVLFIASGAFNGIEEMVKNRISSLGFNRNQLSKGELVNQKPTREDILKYGMLDQLVRRFPNIAYTKLYDYNDLYQILKLKKTPFISDVIRDFAALGIAVTVEDEVYQTLARLAAKPEGSGAGELMELVNNSFRDYFYELGERQIEAVTIDQKFIDDPKGTLDKILRDSSLKEPQGIIPANNQLRKNNKRPKQNNKKLTGRKV